MSDAQAIDVRRGPRDVTSDAARRRVRRRYAADRRLQAYGIAAIGLAVGLLGILVTSLVFTGYPGAPRSNRQLQASSSLFYEVFRKYDAGNLLLGQAEGEVLSQELDIRRLAATLKRMSMQTVDFVELKVPSPFSLPLMVERFRETLTNEKLADRLARIIRDAERVADTPA